MTLLKHANRAFSTLASGITDVALSLSVSPTDGAKFPASGTFNVTIFKPATPDTNREIVAVTGRTGDVFTITRGAEGTTPVAHDLGDYVWLNVTSALIDGLETEIGLKMATADDAAAAVTAMGVKGDANPLNHDKYVHPNHTGQVTSVADGATTVAGPVALTAMATQAAQTVLANATDSPAAPTAIAIAASQIVARLAAGNLKGCSTTEMKTLLAYLTDLIDDTSPQLGGDLDANGKAMSAVKSLDFSDFAVLTIDTGAVTVTQTCHTLTAAAATHPVDDLDTINGGTNGMVIFIKPTAGDDITVKHHTGNIWLKGAADILLDEDSDLLQLVFDGAHWCDVGGPSGATTTMANDPLWSAAGDVAVATANDTATVVNLTEQTVLGRITAGAVKALSVAELWTLIVAAGGTMTGPILGLQATMNTAIADHAYWGITLAATAHEAIAITDVCFMNSDGEWAIADADAEATTKGLLGMAVAAADSAASCTCLTYGLMRDDSGWGGAMTDGAPYFLSCTSGDVTSTAPSGSADCVRIVGHSQADRVFFFAPSPDWMELL